MEWGDALMRRNSPEAFQQARVAFDMMRKIMGRHPLVVKNPLHPNPDGGDIQAAMGADQSSADDAVRPARRSAGADPRLYEPRRLGRSGASTSTVLGRQQRARRLARR